MNRRDLLKLLSLAGAGSLLGGLSLWQGARGSRSYFLLTDRPDADLATIREWAGRHAASLNVATTPVQPAAQDLAVMAQGRLVDPVRDGGVPDRIAALAAEMRTRSRPGHTLLSVEPATPAPGDAVVIEQDGVVWDRISLTRNYRRIETPGPMGTTIFALQDGRLSVVAASCRHALCQKMGARRTGKIICAPNRLVVTLPGVGVGVGVDAVTG